jgi:hypothetical protein
MSKTSKTEETSNPPAWAMPLLQKGAGDAMALYNSDKGYHPYMGPTRAGFSDVSLGGMNNALAATGYKGAPVTNDSWQKNSAVMEAKKMIQDMMAGNNKAPQPQAQDSNKQVTPQWVTEALAGQNGQSKWLAMQWMKDYGQTGKDPQGQLTPDVMWKSYGHYNGGRK